MERELFSYVIVKKKPHFTVIFKLKPIDEKEPCTKWEVEKKGIRMCKITKLGRT